MNRFQTILRVSTGLALLTVSLLMLADWLGLYPDIKALDMEFRKNTAEVIALQMSQAVSEHNFAAAQSGLDALKKRQPNVLSAALRGKDGRILVATPEHAPLWAQDLPTEAGEKSTPTHVHVTIFSNRQPWGQLEIRFAALSGNNFWPLNEQPVLQFAVFFFVAGLLVYFFYMKKTLRQLDPASVIPERVKAALNTLAEGILILDEQEQIVHANATFGEQVGRDADSLLGLRISELPWQKISPTNESQTPPWTDVLRDGCGLKGIPVYLMSSAGVLHSLMMNGAPIFDAKSRIRGMIATFDDVTELETKNSILEKTVAELERSRQTIIVQNEELQLLATRDPLTGCFNRRAFFEQFANLLSEARSTGIPLSCIMSDIDHFKSINDNHGHATGDKVIKIVAEILQTKTRAEDIAGRYGGEEFCIIVPGLEVEQAGELAERIRELIEHSGYRFTSGLRITSSFGVSCLDDTVADAQELVDRADKALYRAKKTGRNKVVCWDPSVEAVSEEPANHPQQRGDDAKTHATAQDQPHDPAAEHGTEITRLHAHIKELEKIVEERSREVFLRNHFDNLTGLPNLGLFVDRIAHAIGFSKRNRRKLAVLVITINNYKTVNDSLGLSAGDGLVKDISQRLNAHLRTSDSVSHIRDLDIKSNLSRVNPDGFGILLTDLDRLESISWVVKRIFELLGFPFNLDGQDVFINANVGISVFPEDGDKPEELFKSACLARDHATKQGINNYAFFSKEIHELSSKHLQFENWLYHALEHEEFDLHYQPKLQLDNQQISGFEALIRWNKPGHGMIPPNDFIPIAERCGLIQPIGEWVIRKACEHMADWDELNARGCSVAVNLSIKQLQNPDLSEMVERILRAYRIPANRVEFEVTESVFMDNSNLVFENIRRLNEQGHPIHIDDFGTGYSSLSYLKHLPASAIKIDRVFVKEMMTESQDMKIVHAIISMAHSMKMNVVAEGVENEEQLALLKTLKCDSAQGYLLSKPLPYAEAQVYLQANREPALRTVRSNRKKIVLVKD